LLHDNRYGLCDDGFPGNNSNATTNAPTDTTDDPAKAASETTPTSHAPSPNW